LFRDLEQVSTEEPQFLGPSEGEQKRSARTLGLGLAMVARIVRTMDGQLRLKSEEGQGSRFVVQLPFRLPEESPQPVEAEGAESMLSIPVPNPVASAPPSVTAPLEGEITLVDRGSGISIFNNAGEVVGGEGSAGSRRSMESHQTEKSDADRLIDAIQTPLSLHDKEPEWPLSRQSSKGSSSKPKSRSLAGSHGGSLSPQSQKRPVSLSMQPRDEIGFVDVRDSSTPIRPIKVPDEYRDMPTQPAGHEQSHVLFELPSDSSQKEKERETTESVTSSGTLDEPNPLLQVLVAEDDPINMKVLKKRLERAGHEITHTVNGEHCATVYQEQSPAFDVVLMDMQMPIVDGLSSTKMIRSIEASPEHRGHSSLAKSNGRIPIFAVSASLVETEKHNYVDAGFDGWILKPIDFKRLATLLLGITDEATRSSCLYVPGEWERGGWFHERLPEPGSSQEVTPTGEDTKTQILGGSNDQTPTEPAQVAEPDAEAS
jgi:CheY-like chemotaxis protein